MKFLLGILLVMGLGAEEKRWVVYYGADAPIEQFSPYQVVALDSDSHPSVKALKERGKVVLGYISLGEVETYRHFFKEVKSEGILGKENKNWPGSYYVDLRNPLWKKRVVEKLIPAILHQGFDGLILDTLDNAEVMEKENPGMIQGAIELVKAIREHYPTIPIMVNRGFVILPDVASSITMVLGEDMMTEYDFAKKEYFKLDAEQVSQNIQTLKAAKEKNPGLEVYTLDYWRADQPEEIKLIYEQMRQEGFIPYVGTIDLQQIIPEPK